MNTKGRRGLPLLMTILATATACQAPLDFPPQPESNEGALVEHINPRSPADGDVAPFSGAVWVDNTLHISGSLGLEGGQVPETAEQEATNVMNNVRSVLERAGLTMDDLVSVQVFASDVGDYAAFNQVYRTYFTSEFPARAFIGSGPLLFGARFEVLGIAVQR